DAEALLIRSLALCKRVLGQTHERTLKCLSTLIDLYKAMGDPKAAEQLLNDFRESVSDFSADAPIELDEIPRLQPLFETLAQGLITNLPQKHATTFGSMPDRTSSRSAR